MRSLRPGRQADASKGEVCEAAAGYAGSLLYLIESVQNKQAWHRQPERKSMEDNVRKSNINWYPGHMAKTKRMMEENIKLVDVVVEIVDARIPFSSKNPYLNRLWQRRPRVIVLNKTDLADEAVTKRWKEWYQKQGFGVTSIDALHGKGMKEVSALAVEMCKEKRARDAAKGYQNRPIRMMITGIPNVGKSTLINQVAGRSGAAKTGNKPGVTKGKQWIKVRGDLELLDTPGILWPKFDDLELAYKIAFIGSIKDEVLDTYTMAAKLLECLVARYPKKMMERFKLNEEHLQLSGEHLLEEIGKKRGHLRAGGIVDVERTAILVMDEFRSAKIGRVSLETPEEVEAAREAAKDAAHKEENQKETAEPAVEKEENHAETEG